MADESKKNIIEEIQSHKIIASGFLFVLLLLCVALGFAVRLIFEIRAIMNFVNYKQLMNLLKMNGSFIFALVGFIIAGISLYYLIVRTNEFQEQGKTAQKQAEIANKQAETARQQAENAANKRLDDRFRDAIILLGNSERSVRIGGIYVLNAISLSEFKRAKDESKNEDKGNVYSITQIALILCNFVREQSNKDWDEYKKTNQDDTEMSKFKIYDDVQTALDVLTKIPDKNAENVQDNLYENFPMNFSSAKLNGADFASAKLNGANFSKAKLNGANFVPKGFNRAYPLSELAIANFIPVKLNGADFSYAELTDADFSYAELNKADFTCVKSKSRKVIFNRAELNGANFSHAELDNAEFCLAKLNDVKFYYLLSELNRADSTYAKLNGANFLQAELNGADFSYAKLNKAQFIDVKANLNKAIFLQANLTEANFFKAELKGANFSYAELRKSNFECAKLNKAQFEYANLNEAIFLKAELKGATFDLLGPETIESHSCNEVVLSRSSGELNHINLNYAKLHGAKFNNMKLFSTACFFDHAEFNNANFDNVEFAGTRFSYVKFNDANFDYVKFCTIIFNKTEPNNVTNKETNFNGATFNETEFTKVKLSDEQLEVVFRNQEKPKKDVNDGTITAYVVSNELPITVENNEVEE